MWSLVECCFIADDIVAFSVNCKPSVRIVLYTFQICVLQN